MADSQVDINFCANMASIITPLIIGFIISGTGNFFYALIYIGLTAPAGMVAYIFIIGATSNGIVMK